MKVLPNPFAILTVALCLLIGRAAVADSTYPPQDRPSRDGRCTGDNGVSDFDRSEKACLAQVGELARRAGSSLELKFRDGKTRVYLNEDAICQSADPSDCVKYQLTGYFPEHDILLLELDYWEGLSWRLVRADSGEESKIVAPPHYSPSRQWLASVASGEGPSGPPNGMDVVPTKADPALREWHYRTPDDSPWLYEFAGWDGDNRVKLDATSLGAPERHAQTSIDRRNGRWRLAEPK
ncbi:hypothetical protein [Bradyrhizobium sp. SK17]|uniref:hypothetical protein n=1 Tax=Bradyrhizobium sp. SK17 TaxID=2057741 RepID=UPI001AEC9F7E|nr:hypothetical protein [Bradyrhizobium sp. SK17]